MNDVHARERASIRETVDPRASPVSVNCGQHRSIPVPPRERSTNDAYKKMSAVDDELPDAPRETPTPGPMSYAHALDTSSGSSSLSDRSMLAVTTEEDDSSHANRVPRAEEQGPGFRDGDDDDAATTVSDATTTTTTTTITDADDAIAPARGGESRKKPTHRRGGARGGGSRERGGQRHHHPSHLAVDEWATQSSWAAQAQRMHQYPHSAYAHAGAAAYVPIHHDHRDAEPPPPGTGVLHPTSHLGRGADERPPYARTYGDDVIDPYAAAALMYGYGYANADPVLVANYTAWQLRQHAAAAAAHAAAMAAAMAAGGGVWPGAHGGASRPPIGRRGASGSGRRRQPLHKQRTVYVHGLPADVVEEELDAALAAAGAVAEIRLYAGFAFVAFDTPAAAVAAVAMKTINLCGVDVAIKPSETSVTPVNPRLLPRSEEEKERCARTVYVTNLHVASTACEVRELFNDVGGAVARAHVHGDPSRGSKIAFVEFETLVGARAAMARGGATLKLRGRVLRVSPSKTPLHVDGDAPVSDDASTGASGDMDVPESPSAQSVGSGASFGGTNEFGDAMSFGSFDSHDSHGGHARSGSHDSMSAPGSPPWVAWRRNSKGSMNSSMNSRGSSLRGSSASLHLLKATSESGAEPTMWHNVHVSNVSPSVSESALARVFAGCGRVLDCRTCGDCGDKKKFAFVAFETSHEVDQALTLDGFVVDGRAIRVTRSKTAVIPVNPGLLPTSEADVERCGRTVYVSNIDPTTSDDDLKRAFEANAGAIRRAHALSSSRRDARNAFIEFENASSAVSALGMSGRVIGARKVRVVPSKTPLKIMPSHATKRANPLKDGSVAAVPGKEDAAATAGALAKMTVETGPHTTVFA